jgi:DNA-binding NarL/FixJ family response regulator
MGEKPQRSAEYADLCATLLRLGVGGIFMKHSSPLTLTQAIRKVMMGETSLDENAIQSLVRALRHPKGADQTRPFTERESQV